MSQGYTGQHRPRHMLPLVFSGAPLELGTKPQKSKYSPRLRRGQRPHLAVMSGCILVCSSVERWRQGSSDSLGTVFVIFFFFFLKKPLWQQRKPWGRIYWLNTWYCCLLNSFLEAYLTPDPGGCCVHSQRDTHRERRSTVVAV